ncbi:hypothetical protein KDN24_24560 [Bacillus sp. Bva_UNVM-123]|uniref:hypothetical protein n=1 Tax=Bacillus sp. Bva_UNVM-123 TaxID=2829798 RepID=UPI00391F8FC9
MNINVDFPIHVAAIFSGLLSWIVIGVLAYRSFAWLGFFSNFIFLTAAFITIPVQQAIYPENKLANIFQPYNIFVADIAQNS